MKCRRKKGYHWSHNDFTGMLTPFCDICNWAVSSQVPETKDKNCCACTPQTQYP